MSEINPEWRRPEPHEIAETHINFLTGEVTQKTVGEVIEEYRRKIEDTGWSKEKVRDLNRALGLNELR